MNKEKIEDYCEPVQEIMGVIPSWITRWGAAVISCVVIVLLCGCCIIKYPETVTGTIELFASDTAQFKGRVLVPSSGIGKIIIGQDVNIKLNGFSYMEYGLVKGMVSNVSHLPNKNKDERIYYTIEIQFPYGLHTTYGVDLPFIEGMDGIAEIITNDRKLIMLLIAPLNLF